MVDTSMDVDMDIDYEDPEIARMRAEAEQMQALPEVDMTTSEAMDAVEDGEVGPDEISPTKIHIEGIESLTTNDLENFANDNYHTDALVKIEWVHDNSANIVYRTSEAATEALRQLATAHPEDPLELRPAAKLLTNPDIELFVRRATSADVKKKGAARESRFYLNNPQYDPENRLRGGFRGRARGRGRGRGGRYDERASRRSSGASEPFDVDLYDDNPQAKATVATRRAGAQLEQDLLAARQARRAERQDEDLISSRKDGRLRNRSASPIRDGDGRYGFSDDQPQRRTARYRSPPRPRPRSNTDNYVARDSMRTELFPHKKGGAALANGRSKDPVELFPNRASSPANGKADLIAGKFSSKRQQDVHPNDITNAIDRRPTERNQRDVEGKPRDLFSRIDGGRGLSFKPKAGILSEANESDSGFSIKGAGGMKDLNVRGASRIAPPVRELIPGRGSARPDLFPNKARGGPRRQQAEDLF